MRRAQRLSGEIQAGWVLLELLLCCALTGALAMVAVPAVYELYLEAAVEYETECLYSDIRKLQVLSRTTCYNRSGPERPVSWKKYPSLALGATGYRWRQGNATFQKHECLPGVEMAVEGYVSSPEAVIAFTATSWPDNRLMTIDVYAKGHRAEGRRIMISNGRVRAERGKGT